MDQPPTGTHDFFVVPTLVTMAAVALCIVYNVILENIYTQPMPPPNLELGGRSQKPKLLLRKV